MILFFGLLLCSFTETDLANGAWLCVNDPNPPAVFQPPASTGLVVYDFQAAAWRVEGFFSDGLE